MLGVVASILEKKQQQIIDESMSFKIMLFLEYQDILVIKAIMNCSFKPSR